MSANHAIMKKLLEVFIDDQGRLDYNCENETLFDDIVSDDLFRKSLEVVIGHMWREKDTCFSKVVRFISMLEMCACAAPYEQAEEFWSTMMFDCIPASEKYANPMKAKYRFDASNMVRPKVMGGTSIMSMAGFGPGMKLPN